MSDWSFRKLDVWMEGLDLVDAVYDATAAFPKEERFELASQMRKAAVSIPSNIAEGQQRGSDADFAKFIGYSLGSLGELVTQAVISGRRKYIPEGHVEELIGRAERVARMARSLQNRLRGGGS